MPRFLMTMMMIASLTAWSAACADPPPAEEDATGTDDPDGSSVDGNIEDGAGNADGSATTKDGGATDDKDAPATPKDADKVDTGGDPVDAGDLPDGEAPDPDATGTDKDAGGTADSGGVIKPKLPLPECALSCDQCAKCPDAQMCVGKTTYANDCFAVCDLQAFDWPKGYKPVQGKCPDCEFCSAGDKPGATPKFCAKTKSGPWVPVWMECELGCVELPDDKDSCEGGKCKKGGVTCKTDFECNKKYVIAGGCAKQNACMQPPSSCPVAKFQPVCASDGESYQTTCAMNNCGLKGCYPLESDTKSAGCDGKLTKLCDGECYDETKWKGCENDKACKPVCGIHKDGKGISYRNGCIANLEGASVADCEGIVVQNGKCSAQLYAGANDGKGRGCCDIDYSIKKPVCASRTDKDGKATWYTFRSNGEFDCLTSAPDEKKNWTFQYLGPCVCQCPDALKAVCGADGQTYQNACQAECYNGKDFQYKPGECGTP